MLSLLEDRERNLWVGTRDGLLQLKRRKFFVYGTSDGLANDFITALFGGRDGDLWVGTRAGLDRLTNGRARRLPAGQRRGRDAQPLGVGVEARDAGR